MNRFVAALAVAALAATAAPTTAQADSLPVQRSFRAGFEAAIVAPLSGSLTKIKVPTASVCAQGDGSLTVQAYELGDAKVGVSITTTCVDGVATYTGRMYLDGATEIDPVDYPLNGGDRLRINISGSEDWTALALYSSARWGVGAQNDHALNATKYTAYTSGELSGLGDSDDLDGVDDVEWQRFRHINVGGERMGELDPTPFSDSCLAVSELRYRWNFDTSYTC